MILDEAVEVAAEPLVIVSKLSELDWLRELIAALDE